MTILSDLILGLVFLLRGVFDALLGRRRRQYVATVDIKAPRDVVWAAASAQEIVFEGTPNIEVSAARRPGTDDIYEGAVKMGDYVMPLAYREVERKPGEGLVIEILKEGSDPGYALGDDYYVVCTFADRPDGGTRLTLTHELTHSGFLSRVLVPLGARQNGRRLRTHCERLAGTAADPARGSRVRAAILTGVLTYASFMYLFDWQFAAILLLLLLIHEAGHALAMRWVGQPVQGIYFIPFMGGVAVAAAPHRSEGERGFVALMGPGVSLVTTAAFLVGLQLTGQLIFFQLALLSAILNGLNLAPVLPLDGGQVVDAALSRADPEMVAILNFMAVLAGIGVSLYLGWYVLTGLLVLTSPMLLAARKRGRMTEPISLAGRNWLVAGYIATVAFYVATAALLLT